MFYFVPQQWGNSSQINKIDVREQLIQCVFTLLTELTLQKFNSVFVYMCGPAYIYTHGCRVLKQEFTVFQCEPRSFFNGVEYISLTLIGQTSSVCKSIPKPYPYKQPTVQSAKVKVQNSS